MSNYPVANNTNIFNIFNSMILCANIKEINLRLRIQSYRVILVIQLGDFTDLT